MSDANGAAARMRWVLLLAGPVIWFTHFIAVYLATEVGCAVGGFGFRLLGLEGVAFVTVAATVIAAVAIAGFTVLALARWRAGRRGDLHNATLFTGVLLGLFSLVAVLFVGIPAVVLQPC